MARMFPLAKNHERSQSIGIQSDVAFLETILGGEHWVWRCGNLSYSSCAVQSENVRNKFKLTRYPD